MERYRGHVGAEAIKGFDPKTMSLPTRPFYCHVGNYHVVAELNLLEGRGAGAEAQLGLADEGAGDQRGGRAGRRFAGFGCFAFGARATGARARVAAVVVAGLVALSTVVVARLGAVAAVVIAGLVPVTAVVVARLGLPNAAPPLATPIWSSGSAPANVTMTHPSSTIW